MNKRIRKSFTMEMLQDLINEGNLLVFKDDESILYGSGELEICENGGAIQITIRKM